MGRVLMSLPTEYQNFIYLSRYSRWLEEEGRRETWDETVNRLITFFKVHVETNLGVKDQLDTKDWTMIRNAILNLEPAGRTWLTSILGILFVYRKDIRSLTALAHPSLESATLITSSVL